MRSGALAEDEQVGEGVPAQPVRAVQAGRALTGGEEPLHGGHLRLRIDPNPTHDVVRGRPHLHRLARDVDVRELEELVVHAGELLLDHCRGIGDALLDPTDVEEHAAVRAAASFADLAHDAAGDVVAREQLGRPARALVALRVAESLVFVVGGLVLVGVGNVVEEEAAALAVEQDASFAAHALGDEDPLHGRRPDHPGGMELDELHVHQLGAGVIREGVPVTRVLPAVAGDLVCLADPACREHHGAGAEDVQQALLAVVPERARDPLAVLQQRGERVLHVHVDALVDPMILKRADHLQARPVADVRKARITVAAEVALQDPPVLGAVEERAPGLQLPDPVRRLLGVQLGHAPVVHVLAAPHRVGEVHPPAVALVDVGERRGDSALGHHGVRLAEERLAHQAHRDARCRRLDRRAQARAAGADHQHVVLVRLVPGGHAQKILQSRITPIEQSRT